MIEVAELVLHSNAISLLNKILLNDGAFGEEAFIWEKWKLLEMKNEKNYVGFLFP